MPTLHNTTEEIKTAIKWGAVVIGVFIFLLFFFRIGSTIKELLFPTPPPAPQVSFGKLSPPVFPPNAAEGPFTYTVNTISGHLPQFSNQLKVYKIIKLQPNLLALQRNKERVARVGFNSAPTAISSIIYQWSDTIAPFRKMIVNITNLNFTLSSNFLFDPTVFASKNLPDEKGAENTARSFLSNLSSMYDDIDTAKTKTQMLAIQNFQLISATSFSSTNIIRVDYFQKNIDDLRLYYPYPPYSTINLFIGSNGTGGQVVMANFNHQTVDNDSATYPIYAASEALSRLKADKGYIASYFGTNNNITITNISLGYYMSDTLQDFLTPIFVFEGNEGFIAYEEAVRDEWFTK